MRLQSYIADGLAPLIDCVYPPRCPLCGTGVSRQAGLCSECWCELIIPGEPACATCARPLASSAQAGSTLCGACLKRPPRHAGIFAGTIYNEPSRRLVLAFKHGGKIGLAPHLAKIMAARIPQQSADRAIPLIVPVPLHRWRLWQRGYNQAAMLAAEIAKLGKGSLAVDLLLRTRKTPPLGGLGRKARKRTLRGAITVNPARRPLLQGRDVILVDDVLTSGATSDACVIALKKSGANSVRIACFARVLDQAVAPGENSFQM